MLNLVQVNVLVQLTSTTGSNKFSTAVHANYQTVLYTVLESTVQLYLNIGSVPVQYM